MCGSQNPKSITICLGEINQFHQNPRWPTLFDTKIIKMVICFKLLELETQIWCQILCLMCQGTSFRFGDGDAGASFATGHGECFPRIPSDIVNLGNASSINACTEDISADGRSPSLHPLFALTLRFSRRGRRPRDTLLSVDFTILADTLRSSPPGPWRPPDERPQTP